MTQATFVTNPKGLPQVVLFYGDGTGRPAVPKSVHEADEGEGHWVTIDGHPVFIAEPVAGTAEGEAGESETEWKKPERNYQLMRARIEKVFFPEAPEEGEEPEEKEERLTVPHSVDRALSEMADSGMDGRLFNELAAFEVNREECEKSGCRAYYSSVLDAIVIGDRNVRWQTVAHEFGHFVDHCMMDEAVCQRMGWDYHAILKQWGACDDEYVSHMLAISQLTGIEMKEGGFADRQLYSVMEEKFDSNNELLHHAPSAYATWDRGEWFAESFKDYVETGGLLIEQNFPATYKLIDGVMKGGAYRSQK